MAAEADGYKELVAGVMPLSIADAAQGGEARLFSLDDRCFGCTVMNRAGMLRIDGLAQKIVTGMCGMPIVDHNGSAIGVICNGSVDDNGKPSASSPALVDQLPAWLLRSISEGRLRYQKQRLADERASRPEPAAGAEHLSLVLDEETKAAIAELKRQSMSSRTGVRGRTARGEARHAARHPETAWFQRLSASIGRFSRIRGESGGGLGRKKTVSHDCSRRLKVRRHDYPGARPPHPSALG
jgi:hypothetical protein